MSSIRELVCLALLLYGYLLFAWVIFSWIRVPYDHPLAKVNLWLDKIIYPLILPIRRVVPPLRLGGVALDMAVIVLFIGISVLRRLVC